VFAGVGVNLRERCLSGRDQQDIAPVQRHRAHLQQALLTCQQQNLNEKPLDLLQKAPPEERTFSASDKRSLTAIMS